MDAFIHHPSSNDMKANGIIHQGKGYLPIKVGDFVGLSQYSTYHTNIKFNKAIDLNDGKILCIYNSTNVLYACICEYNLNILCSVIISTDCMDEPYLDAHVSYRQIDDDRYIIAWYNNNNSISTCILSTSGASITVGNVIKDITENNVRDIHYSYEAGHGVECIAINDNFIYIIYQTSDLYINISCLTFTNDVLEMELISSNMAMADMISSRYIYNTCVDLGNGHIFGIGDRDSYNNRRMVKITFNKANAIQSELIISSQSMPGEKAYGNGLGFIRLSDTKYIYLYNTNNFVCDVTYTDTNIGFDVAISYAKVSPSLSTGEIIGICQVSNYEYLVAYGGYRGSINNIKVYKYIFNDSGIESCTLLYGGPSLCAGNYMDKTRCSIVFVDKSDNPRLSVFLCGNYHYGSSSQFSTNGPKGCYSFDSNFNDLTIVTSTNKDSLTDPIYGICIKKLGNDMYEYVVPNEQL